MKNLNKYRITAFALIISFSIISGSEFWHHHNDVNYDESHCTVCLIIHSFAGTNLNEAPEIVHPAKYRLLNIVPDDATPESPEITTQSERAPPHIS